MIDIDVGLLQPKHFLETNYTYIVVLDAVFNSFWRIQLTSRYSHSPFPFAFSVRFTLIQSSTITFAKSTDAAIVITSNLTENGIGKM